MKLTKQQIENTRMAYAIMAGYPAHRVNLAHLRVVQIGYGLWAASAEEMASPECGSVGCIAGVIGAHPYFRALGMGRGPEDLWLDVALFGADMFSGGPSGLRGKRAALERLRLHLRTHGAITRKRNAELMAQELRMVS